MAKVRLVMAAMGEPKPRSQIYAENLEMIRQTLYRHVSPDRTLREDGGNF